jgi:type I restriction enzyme S subunit
MPQDIFDALPDSLLERAAGLPNGWASRSVSACCSLVSGGTPRRSKPSYWGTDVPWYSVKDAPEDGQVWVIRTDEGISHDGLQNSAAQIVPKGTTIISARGTVGKLAMAGQPMAFNQSCYGLVPIDGRSYYYLYLLMQTIVSELQQRSHGSVFDTITRSTFDAQTVTVPPATLVSRFHDVVEPLFDELLLLLRESSKLAEVRDYLLPQLLSGVIRVEVGDG